MIFKLRRILLLFLLAAVLSLACMAAAVAASYRLGDADTDTKITIIDATCIQRYLAGLPINGRFSEIAADVDGSGKIEITDATFIQRWLVNLKTPYDINELFESPAEATETATQPPTEAAAQRPTDEEGWGRDIFRP